MWLNKQIALDKRQGNLGTGVQILLKKGKGITSEGQGSQHSQGMDSKVGNCNDRKQDNLLKLSVLLFSSSTNYIQYLREKLRSLSL